jgi:hypothetical protein
VNDRELEDKLVKQGLEVFGLALSVNPLEVGKAVESALHSAVEDALATAKGARERSLEAIDALSYVDDSTDAHEMAHKTIQILQGVELTDFEYESADNDEDIADNPYPRPPMVGDVVENIVVSGLDWREVVAVSEHSLVLALPGTDLNDISTWAWLPIDRFAVRIPRTRTQQ